MLSSSVVVLSLCAALLVYHICNKRTKYRRLPPGPPPTPVFGNISGIDPSSPWKSYEKWGKEYGDIIYTRFWNQDIIVINAEKVAQDLLDTRSQNYSTRPASLHAMMDFIGMGFSSLFLPYGDRWRLHRRIFHEAFYLNAITSFRPVQLRKTKDLITHLTWDPQSYPEHLHTFSISTIMSIVYDYQTLGRDDPIIDHLGRAMNVGQMSPELAAIITAFPFPPGADFKRKALIFRKTIARWVDAPFEYVRNRMAEGTAATSVVSDALLRIRDKGPMEADATYLERAVKEACASAYAAAAETTYSTLLVFIFVMVLYPDVQAQAQNEIDSVIGVGLPRLPHWDDRISLPYVEAVVKEILRWHPVVPLGVPHATMDNDIYKGYHIPKGATVIANLWAISQDPMNFPEPEKFEPERFLGEETRSVDQLSFAFGFGRRVCAGRYVADASLWISIVSMLAVFRFEAPPSWNPGPDGVNVEWTSGSFTRPKNVPCIIKLRHKNVNRERLARLVGSVAM